MKRAAAIPAPFAFTRSGSVAPKSSPYAANNFNNLAIDIARQKLPGRVKAS